MTVTPRQIYKASVKVEACRRATLKAADYVLPERKNVQFHRELSALCDRLADAAVGGKPMRAVCCAPPRHGKTEIVGKALPLTAALRAKAAGRALRVLYVTSSKDRARDVSIAVRRLCAQIYRTTGDDWWAPGAKWTATEWVTKGGFGWVGIGWSAGTGGVGADLVIMDDLLGSGKAYRSKAVRLALRKAVEEDLLSRLMGPCAAIHMETRRGIEDTTEWLLTSYPGVWERHVWRCFDEETGEYLWGDRFGEIWRSLNPGLTPGSALWRALYQQEPVPEGGSVIHPDWLAYTYSEPPKTVAVMADRIVIGVDLATTAKTKSDACAFVVIAVRGAFRDVLFVKAEPMEYPDARRYLEELVAEWKPKAVVVEAAAHGTGLVADLKKRVAGIRTENPIGDKVLRVVPHLPRMAAGQLRLPSVPEPWVREFREELTGFTGLAGEPDDQVDATVWALVAAEPIRKAPPAKEVLERMERGEW